MPRKHEKRSGTLVHFCAALLMASTGLPAAWAGQLEVLTKTFAARRASQTASGDSRVASMSADGRYVVLLSQAPNLVAGQLDENNLEDVFLHDGFTGRTVLVSRTARSSTTAGNGGSNAASISADGRYVAFTSAATDLAEDLEIPSGQSNVYLFDRVAETVTLVSRSADGDRAVGAMSPVVSADGRYVAFVSFGDDLVRGQVDTNGASDLFVWDRQSGRSSLVSHAASSASRAASSGLEAPSMSSDGRWIAYTSYAQDLVPGMTSGEPFSSLNVFLFDRTSGKNILVSRAAGTSTVGVGVEEAAVISANGEAVAFVSTSSRVVAGQTAGQQGEGYSNVFLFHRPSGQMSLVSHASTSSTQASEYWSTHPLLSSDGAWVAFTSHSGDLVAGQSDYSSPTRDVFLWERASGAVRLISHAIGSATHVTGANVHLRGLSADGQRMLLESDELAGPTTSGTWVANVFLADRSGDIHLVSTPGGSSPVGGNGASTDPVLSADGNQVAFRSEATDLGPAGLRDLNAASDVFLYSPTTGDLEIVTRRDPGLPQRSVGGFGHSLSADGRFAVFVSDSPDIVPRARDLNGQPDVFLYDRVRKTTALVSHSAAGALQAGNQFSSFPQISADGRFVIYESYATDLIPGQIDDDEGGSSLDPDLFLYDRTTGQTTLVSRSADSPVTCVGVINIGTISADGSFIAFSSLGRNLVPGQDPSENAGSVFLYERATGAMILVSHVHGSPLQPSEKGAGVSSLSADGRFILVGSHASDLVSPPPSGVEELTSSALYLYDRITRTMTLITRPNAPGLPVQEGSGAISADGRWVVVGSFSSHLVPGQVDEPDFGYSYDIFLWDRVTQTMRLVSHAVGKPAVSGGAGYGVGMSADGRWITFVSGGDLVAGYRGPTNIGQILLYDRTTGTNRLASSSAWARLYDSVSDPRMSPDGRFIAFVSDTRRSPEPVQSQTNNVYLFDRSTGKTVLVSRSNRPPFTSGNGPSGNTNDGTFERMEVSNGGIVLFDSLATNLVPGDYNFKDPDYPGQDAFLYVP